MEFSNRIVGLYERHARAFDRERNKMRISQKWDGGFAN
jgi:hypothetical protein